MSAPQVLRAGNGSLACSDCTWRTLPLGQPRPTSDEIWAAWQTHVEVDHA